MGELKLRFNIKNLLFILVLVLILFIVIEPVVFVFTDFHELFRIAQIIILTLSIIMCYLKECDVKFILLALSFFIVLSLVTFYESGALNKVFTIFLPIFALLFTLQYSFTKNWYLSIKSLYIYFTIVVYTNFIFLLLYPDGILTVGTYGDHSVGYHFLSVSNQIGPYLLIAGSISFIYVYVKGRMSINVIVLNVIIYITVLMVWSATSIAWITVFYILLFLIKSSSLFSQLVNWKRVTVIIISFHILIVFIKAQEWISFFVMDILNKDFTLSGRTRIWDLALDKIKGSWLFGYGEIQDARYIIVGTAQFNAHNIFLQIMLQGGLVLLLLFSSILLFSLYNSRYFKNNFIRNTLLITILILFSMMISEVYSYLLIFLLMFLTYQGKNITEMSKSKKM